jgi:signal transduction histidine kinase
LKLTLKTKLVLSYVAVAAFLVVSLLFVSNYYLDKQFQIYVAHKQDMKNMEIVDAVSKNFSGSAASPDAGFLNFLTGFGDSLLEQGIALMVYDASGAMIYCTNIEDGAGCSHMHALPDAEWSAVCPDFDSTYSQDAFGIDRDGKIMGTIKLGYHGPFYYNEGDQSFLSAYNRVFFGMSALFFTASIAIGLLVAGMIAGPIRKVTERTERIAAGEYSGDYIETGTVEIDALSGSVDRLAESLDTQYMLKKRMASAYSHEFRTPLAVLQSNLEAMIDGLWTPTAERLESLRAEIIRMSRMVSEVDKLVQTGSDESRPEKVPSDLCDLAGRVLRGFEANMASKNLSLDFDCEKCEANVDPDKFSQVIFNLVSNAVKYTNPGGHISVRVCGGGDNAVLTVRDDGIGIAGFDIPYIFEHLYRTDESRARDSGGNGIGLSVARVIVEAHGGAIEVKSRLGEGSVFTVTVPVK